MGKEILTLLIQSLSVFILTSKLKKTLMVNNDININKTNRYQENSSSEKEIYYSITIAHDFVTVMGKKVRNSHLALRNTLSSAFLNGPGSNISLKISSFY